MDKAQAEKIITSAFSALLEKLQSQDTYDEAVIIDDLHRLAKALRSKNSVPLNLHTPVQNFELEYQALADQSISSYTETKESVDRIIEDSEDFGSTELDEIMHNFATFHGQIKSHMKKAHKTIKELKQQVSSLKESSNLDPLTRTYNRRALDTYFASLFKKIENFTPDNFILIVDIDDFKNINDSYGHLAGDRVLMFLAKLIISILRDGDKVFRFGGDEFLILLNRSNEDACNSIAERIFNGVRKNSLLFKEQKIKLALSMGSTKLQSFDTIESFIDRADIALLKAKNNGKDQHIAG